MVRQIVLTNVTSLGAVLLTVAYQLFFLIDDLATFKVPFATNLVALAVYLILPWLNSIGRHDRATKIGLATTLVHVFVITWMLGTNSGIQLFYLTIAGVLPLLFPRYRTSVFLALSMLTMLLFVTTYAAFSHGLYQAAIPVVIQHGMYASSGISAMGIAILCGYLFKMEMVETQTRLTATNRRLEQLSTTDALTRVANRRGMEFTLDEQWRHMRRTHDCLSLLICDIDLFKAYNDRFGHPAGDVVLRDVAETVDKALLRPTDLVARYGGEEFVVILPSTSAHDARRVAERIRASVQGLGIAHEESDIAPVITVSIGVATMAPDTGITAHTLLATADRALYDAKHNGRNRIAYEFVPMATQP